MTWLPMKTPESYRVARLNGGKLQYDTMANGSPAAYLTRQAARRRAERLNVAELPSPTTEAGFERLLSGLYITSPMRQALYDLLVQRTTWKAAALFNQVTESGMLRSLRRITAHNMQKEQR